MAQPTLSIMVNSAEVETWTEYAIVVVVILARILSRCRIIGFNWYGDDYCVLIALLAYTSYFVHIEFLSRSGTTIGWTAEQRAQFSDETIRRLVIGSKLLISGWISWATVIWSLKACMLFFYARLTVSAWQRKVVVATAIMSGVTFVTLVLVILLHCYPIQRQWQIWPDPGRNCTLEFANHVSYAVLNIFTDLLLLLIPVPILRRLKMDWKKKLGLWVMFSSGIFLIVATVLRTINTMDSGLHTEVALQWTNREGMMAVITINIPALRPVFSKRFWRRGGYTSRHYESYGANYGATYGSSAAPQAESQSRVRGTESSYDTMSKQGIVSEEEHEIHAITTITVESSDADSTKGMPWFSWDG